MQADAGGPTVRFDELPPEAQKAIEAIGHGGPFPYPQDGAIFYNYERRLPTKEPGYYREYTVETPGLSHRGARRIVIGKDGEVYYTDDHFQNFKAVDR
jgi:ribonuclease T1